MDTSRQTEEGVLWFALCQLARWYKSSCRNTVMFDRAASPSGTTTDRSAAGELLRRWWGLSSSATPLSHPRIRTALQKPCLSRNLHDLMQGMTFIDFRRNIFSNHDWMEASLPPDHMMWEMGMKRKNNRGSSSDFKMGLEGYCMREGGKGKKAATLLYLFHCALCLILYEFVVFSLSPPSSTFTTSLLKGYTYHSQILSWYLSLFADLWILNIFHTDQNFPTLFSSIV